MPSVIEGLTTSQAVRALVRSGKLPATVTPLGMLLDPIAVHALAAEREREQREPVRVRQIGGLDLDGAIELRFFALEDWADREEKAAGALSYRGFWWDADCMGYYVPGESTIHVRARRDLADLRRTVAHEMRHLAQHVWGWGAWCSREELERDARLYALAATGVG